MSDGAPQPSRRAGEGVDPSAVTGPPLARVQPEGVGVTLAALRRAAAGEAEVTGRAAGAPAPAAAAQLGHGPGHGCSASAARAPAPDTSGIASPRLAADGPRAAGLRRIVGLAERAPASRRALDQLERLDVAVALLYPSARHWGHYVIGEGVLYLRCDHPWQGVRTLVHEARHAEQAAAGYSTIVEWHVPGTQLPWDAASYLLLNRVLEADADAHVALASWQLARAVDPGAWSSLLAVDREFAGIAAAFQAAAAGDRDGEPAGMRAAFVAWFTAGRGPGYDEYLLPWIERVVARGGATRAARRLDDAGARAIAAQAACPRYLDGIERPLTGAPFTAWSEAIAARLAGLALRVVDAGGA